MASTYKETLNLPETAFHVMAGFIPSGREGGAGGLDRLVSSREVAQAESVIEELGLVRYAG